MTGYHSTKSRVTRPPASFTLSLSLMPLAFCTHSLAHKQASAQLFRLGVLPDVALAVDRPADQRAAFLRRRWEAGAFRHGEGEGAGENR